MTLVRRGLALILTMGMLLLSASPVLAVNRLKNDRAETREAVEKRSMDEYWRTYKQGWHSPNGAWTVLHYDANTDWYYSILCINPEREVPGAWYEILLSPASMGRTVLEWANYKAPVWPAPPGPEELYDPFDPMWIRYREIANAVGTLPGGANPPLTAENDPSRNYMTLTIQDRGSFYYTNYHTSSLGWWGAEDMGFPKTCTVLEKGTGNPVYPPAVVGLPTDDTDPDKASTLEEREKRLQALAVYPPVVTGLSGSWDGMPRHRTVEHVVVHYPVEYRVSLQASRTAIEPGVPLDLYLRVEHNSKQPFCPVPIGIKLPSSWAVKEAQGATVDPYSGVNQQDLWWTVQLQPGKAAERWVTVVPDEPDEFTQLVTQAVDLAGGLEISVARPGENRAILTLPLASAENPAKAAPALPARKELVDNLPTGICPTGVNSDVVIPPAAERIRIEAKPPVLRSQDGYKTTITARLVDVPGKAASKGAPLTLEASSIGKLTDVKTQGLVTTATLSIEPEQALEKSDILITAKSKDGDRNFLIIPVGGLWLMGKVVNRPGDGSEVPIAGTKVTAKEVGGTREYIAETEANGWYRIKLKEDKQMTVSVSAAGYLPAELPKPVDPPGEDDTALAPDLFLVSRDALQLAQRRLEQIQQSHKSMTITDTLAGEMGLQLNINAPDPTLPDGKIAQFLKKVAEEKSPPPHREEGLRRLNLALEIAMTAGRDAKGYADEVAGAAWDDGIGALIDIWKAIQGLDMMFQKQNPKTSVNLLPQQVKVEEKLTEAVFQVMHKIASSQKWSYKHDPKVEQSKAFLDWVKGKVQDWLKQEIERTYKPESASQKATVDIVTGKAPEILSREIKESLSDFIALAYLEMVSTELSATVDKAANGQFEEGGYTWTETEVRMRTATLAATRTFPPGTIFDEQLKTFMEGTLSQLKGWGYLAITAVTAGHALPAIEKIDMALDLINAFLKWHRFSKGLILLDETLSTSSDWWKAVASGIRATMDYKSGAAATPLAGARSVSLKAGRASMEVRGETKAIDAAPYVAEGRTMVPVRAAAEALGAEVMWDGATQQVTLSRAGHTVVMTLGKSEALVDGVSKSIDANSPQVVPVSRDGRTFVPLRFLADGLGAEIKWDAQTETITLTVP